MTAAPGPRKALAAAAVVVVIMRAPQTDPA